MLNFIQGKGWGIYAQKFTLIWLDIKCRGGECVEIYLHSTVCLNGMVLN